MDFSIENQFISKEFGYDPPPPVKPPTKRKPYVRHKPRKEAKPPDRQKRKIYRENYYLKNKQKIREYNQKYYYENKQHCQKHRLNYYHAKPKEKVECPRCGKKLMNIHLQKHQQKKCCISKYILNT